MSALREASTAELHIAYREDGPPGGPPVLLVHGFPDDVHTWDALVPQLAAAGFRTIAPYVRGFGPTRFRRGVERSGEIAALACDVLALADALDLPDFHYVGHDWGARAGYAVAALRPARVRSLCALANAYGTNTGGSELSLEQVRAYWYQWYFGTPRGEQELLRDRRAFCRYLWSIWSPGWAFGDREFERTAVSFDNEAWVEVVLSSYRQRWGFEPGAPAYAADRERLAALPRIAVPTLTLMGVDDGATLAASAAGAERLFAGPYQAQTLDACGHFLQRQRPDEVGRRVLAHLRAYEGI